MPRVSKSPFVILALSPAGVAASLGIRPEPVQAAIASGALPVHRIGTKNRILIADVEPWVRSWPQPMKKPKRSPHAR